MRGHLRRHAENNRDHAFGQSGIHERARHFQRRRRCMLGRFHDARTSRSQRGAQLAARITNRKIPRRERSHGSYRFSQHGHTNSRRSLRQHAPISSPAFFGVPFQDIGRAVRL